MCEKLRSNLCFLSLKKQQSERFFWAGNVSLILAEMEKKTHSLETSEETVVLHPRTLFPTLYLSLSWEAAVRFQLD